MNESQHLELRVLCFTDRAGDEETWVSFALERDLCAQGDTPEEAVVDLRHIIGVELSLSQSEDEEPLSWLKINPWLHERWDVGVDERREFFWVAGVMVHLVIRTIPRGK